MKKTHELLAEVAKCYPTPDEINHNITVDSTRLVLSVFKDGLWHSLYLDSVDWEMNVEEILDNIKSILEEEQEYLEQYSESE